MTTESSSNSVKKPPRELIEKWIAALGWTEGVPRPALMLISAAIADHNNLDYREQKVRVELYDFAIGFTDEL